MFDVAETKTGRDDFTAPVKRKLAERVGHLCSNPECRAATSGPVADSSKSSSVGIAAHIHAASPGGARYLETQTAEERASIANGIHLCAICAKRVDDDETTYPADVLRAWKVIAEHRASLAHGRPGTDLRESSQIPIARAEMSIECIDKGAINSTAPLLRYYVLNTVLRNVGKIRIDDWFIEVEFPKTFKEPGLTQGLENERRSRVGEVSYFELKSAPHHEPFLANRAVTLPIRFIVNSQFHGLIGAEDGRFLDLPVVARAHVDGVQIDEQRFTMRQLLAEVR